MRRAIRKRRRYLLIVLIITVICASVYVLNFRIRPLLLEVALSEVSDAVSITVNRTISEKMADGTIKYSDLITFEKDDGGRITALITDMAETNALRAEITNDIILKLSDKKETNVGIPVGNLFGSTLLSGRGPKINADILSVSNVETSFSNVFTSAGINQTRHQIMLTIAVDLTILVPGCISTVHIPTEICVAETIIVGEVPYSYTNLE
ncbi:MAG: sporulation protein YunB [Oscillospiraceae bacterium]|nr:sporulation protein YunB [Oscillospiraceae bacterium]